MITNEKSVKRLPKLRMGKKTRGKMCAKCSYQNLNKHGITKPDDFLPPLKDVQRPETKANDRAKHQKLLESAKNTLANTTDD